MDLVVLSVKIFSLFAFLNFNDIIIPGGSCDCYAILYYNIHVDTVLRENLGTESRELYLH